MHIALLHHSAPPVVGGVESVLAHQARLFSAAGHQVTVIAGRGKQTDPHIEFAQIPQVDSRHPDVLLIKPALDSGQVPPGFEGLCSSIKLALEAILQDVDVLIAHNVASLNKNLALTAALFRISQARQTGRPRMILWHHDLAWTTPRYRSELHTGFPWDLLRQAWPGVEQVVISALRHRELTALMGLESPAVAVIPNGIDLARFFKWEARTRYLVDRTGLLKADPIFLLPVRVTPRKNIELALGALASLRAEGFPDAALVVTGPLGPHNAKNKSYFDQLRRLRVDLELTGSAHFLAELVEGFLPDEVIADFYRLADGLLLPSREEGFGIPVLEAGLSRMPIFCSNIQPLRDLCGDDASYFDPTSDPAVVADLIRAKLCTDMTTRWGRRTRLEYSWEQVYVSHLAPLLARPTEA